MSNRVSILICFFLLAVFVEACSSVETATPTTIVPKTPIPLATATSTQKPTPTVLPSPTATPGISRFLDTPILRLGMGRAERFTWIPQTKGFAITASSGVFIFDAAFKQVQSIRPEYYVWDTAVAPDGATIATAIDKTNGQNIILWNVQSGRVDTILGGFQGKVVSVAFSPDEKYLAAGGADGTVQVWNLEDEKLVQRLEWKYENDFPLEVWKVEFSPSGTILATGGGDGTVRLWDTSNWKLISALDPHKESIYSVKFSPDGLQLASAGGDGSIQIWDVQNGKLLYLLAGHSDGVDTLAFSPNGHNLVSAGCEAYLARAERCRESTIKLWDLKTQRLKITIDRPERSVTAVAFNPDGNMLASVDDDRTEPVTFWDSATGSSLNKLDWFTGPSSDIAFLPTDDIIAFGNGDQSVSFVQLATGQEVDRLQAPGDLVSEIAYSPDGHYLATASRSGVITVWDMSAQVIIQSLTEDKGEVAELQWSPDNGLLAWSTSNLYEGDTIQVMEIASGVRWPSLEGNSLFSFEFSPTESLIAAADFSAQVVRFWNYETNERWDLPHETGPVSSIAFSPNGKTIAVGCWDASVKFWNVSTREFSSQLNVGKRNVQTIAFDPDGQELATGYFLNNGLDLWDITARKQTQALNTLAGDIRSISFSNNGTLIAATSADGTVAIWARAGDN